MKLNDVYCRAVQTAMDPFMRNMPWRNPVAITGRGCTDRIPRLLKDEGVKKVMVVSGKTTGKLVVPEILRKLENAGIEYVHFDAVTPNATTDTAEKLRCLYEFEGCQGFLAVGGGSPMDTAKAAAACIARPGKRPEELTGMLKVRRGLPLLIAAPTSAGSGSETTIAAVLTDPRTHVKKAIADPVLVPHYAVLDPCLTESMPPFGTACCGMDALTHALEAYLCRKNNTAQTLHDAEQAAADIFSSLERAVRDGHDLASREKMLMASFRAGCAFTRVGVGYVHAIAHTCGGLYNIAHGLANAVILPIVLEDYGAAAEDKLAHLAEITGIKRSGSAESKALALIAEIRAMNARMGIPEHLDVIREEDIPQMVRWALQEANPTYPVPVIYDEKHCERVIRRVMG